MVIRATSSVSPLFDNLDFNPGIIFCDLSVPPNMARDLHLKRSDILAYEGGRAKCSFFEEIKEKKWAGLFPSNSVYRCLVESLILAFEARFENYSLGSKSFKDEKIEEIYDLGLKHGFSFADFRCFDYCYSEDDFQKIRKIRGEQNDV